VIFGGVFLCGKGFLRHALIKSAIPYLALACFRIGARLKARRLRHCDSRYFQSSQEPRKGAWLNSALRSAIINVNVMTRDTHGLHGDRDSATDAEVYTALWSAATFPHLPTDAPNELKKLTIDVDDPKRIYVIHRAGRRHHFQILVEKFVRPSPLLFSMLTGFIGIFYKSDTAANLIHALHQHVSLVASDLLLVLEHLPADTMRRVLGRWPYISPPRITRNKVFVITQVPKDLPLPLRMLLSSPLRESPLQLMEMTP
jgi:hypothetical protein